MALHSFRYCIPGRTSKAGRRSAGIADRLRRTGITPSLQVASTIGHGGPLGNDCVGSFHPFVGNDGTEEKGCVCPGDRHYYDYFEKMVRLYCQAVRPEGLWLDDDLRLNSRPHAAFGCFCPNCLAARRFCGKCFIDPNTGISFAIAGWKVELDFRKWHCPSSTCGAGMCWIFRTQPLRIWFACSS